MSITVKIEDTCTACGLCEQVCPDVFEMGAIALVKAGVDPSKFEAQVKEAADSCPVQAIILS